MGFFRINWNRASGLSFQTPISAKVTVSVPSRNGYHRVMATDRSHYGKGDFLSGPGLTKAGRRICAEFTIFYFHDERNCPIGTAAILLTPAGDTIGEPRRPIH